MNWNCDNCNERKEQNYCQSCAIKLGAENKQLKQDLIDFGRHSPGCNGPYRYECDCGWKEVSQSLRENNEKEKT